MALPLILAAGGTLLTLYGTNQQIKANEANLEFQNEQLRHKREVSKVMAADAIERGERNARAQGRKVRQVAGQQRAAIAANGFVVDQDTAGDLVDDTINWGKVDVAMLRANARMEALQIEAGGTEAAIQMRMNETSTAYQNQATLINGATSLINAGNNYYRATNG